MYKKIVISIIVVIIIGGTVSVAIFKNKNSPTENELLKTKIDDEMEYLSISLIDILNDLNNITIKNYKISVQTENTSSKESGNKSKSSQEENSSNSDNSASNNGKNENNTNTTTTYKMVENNFDTTEPDWNKIDNQIKKIYSTWSEIVIDLYKVNNNNDDILAFSRNLDEVEKYIESKDKSNSLIFMANLYSYIPKFMNEYNTDLRKIGMMEMKSNIVSAYSLIEQENWAEIKNKLILAEEKYNKILNDIQNNKNQYNMNKAYILLKEFKNSVDTNNKKILYLKYINLIEEIEAIDI